MTVVAAKTAHFDNEVRPFFRDVRDPIQRTEILVDGLREVLLEQRRQAAILAVPTAVAGIYGMNFEHMPELKWACGYYGVLAGIVVICGLLYRRFEKTGWL